MDAVCRGIARGCRALWHRVRLPAPAPVGAAGHHRLPPAEDGEPTLTLPRPAAPDDPTLTVRMPEMPHAC